MPLGTSALVPGVLIYREDICNGKMSLQLLADFRWWPDPEQTNLHLAKGPRGA